VLSKGAVLSDGRPTVRIRFPCQRVCGAPIIRNGVVEEACGVSGGTSQQDEDRSRAGVAQL
jgi:uncharacterized protein GlcG (DUF336 family)